MSQIKRPSIRWGAGIRPVSTSSSNLLAEKVVYIPDSIRFSQRRGIDLVSDSRVISASPRSQHNRANGYRRAPKHQRNLCPTVGAVTDTFLPVPLHWFVQERMAFQLAPPSISPRIVSLATLG